MTAWTQGDIPRLAGRTALVTGASSGLGLRAAEVLANRGARVILTSRDPGRGALALARVRDAATGAPPEMVVLDLADLASIRAAAGNIRVLSHDRLDLLVNNAGVMAPPFAYSRDGIELQWATNVFGPAALTRRLLPALVRVPGSRVVTMSSLAHFLGAFDATRLDSDVAGLHYSGLAYYCRTKLANLLAARTLERYLRRAGAETISLSAHPGTTATQIASDLVADRSPRAQRAANRIWGVFTQPVEVGVLPLLFAATAPGVRGAQYFGPSGIFETRGAPAAAARSFSARSADLSDLLETRTIELTGLALSERALHR